MSLKTVGTFSLTWKACKNCKHGIGGICVPSYEPELHCNRNNNTVECADYLSKDESEE